MSDFEWVGDEKNQSVGEKTKSQVITFDGGIFSYRAYGDVRNEMLNSWGGNDVIIGAEGAISNIFVGDSSGMTDSRGGNDRLIGSDSAGYNGLVGDAFTVSGSKGGNDVLIGGASARINELHGDAVYMTGALTNMSVGGNDTLIGGDGALASFLFGDAMSIRNSFCGNDLLLAGDLVQESYMYGDGRDVYGNTWGGNDKLVSGTGNDNMWGDFRFIASTNINFGRDTFVFKENNGQDSVGDFRSGEDKIEICGIEGLTNYSQLQITVQAGSSIITLGADDTVTLIGVTNLQAQDFIFS